MTNHREIYMGRASRLLEHEQKLSDYASWLRAAAGSELIPEIITGSITEESKGLDIIVDELKRTRTALGDDTGWTQVTYNSNPLNLGGLEVLCCNTLIQLRSAIDEARRLQNSLIDEGMIPTAGWCSPLQRIMEALRFMVSVRKGLYEINSDILESEVVLEFHLNIPRNNKEEQECPMY